MPKTEESDAAAAVASIIAVFPRRPLVLWSAARARAA